MKTILILVLLFTSQICFSQEHSQPNIKQLARDKTWLKLVHFDTKLSAFWRYESVIHSKGFFLAPDGKDNPESELVATIAALNAPIAQDNEHARCRFPARAQWLDALLGTQAHFDINSHCPAYAQWKAENNVESVSVILASGYLGNPASFYGHTFIKFNSDNANLSRELINTTLSYGAINTRNDNIAVYVSKALVGGYHAAFRKISFYNQEQTYNENENRDLWEYQLNLSKKEVDFVANHAWEILDQEYTYYFFRENCAFRLIELLEILPEISITEHIDAYAIPQTVVQMLNNQTIHGQPLLKNKVFYPSRQTQLYDNYTRLNATERVIFKAMVNGEVRADYPEYVQANTESKQKIVDTIIDYYSFVEDAKDKQTKQRHPNYINALLMRFALPAKESRVLLPESSPEKGRSPSWIQLSSYSNSHSEDGALIRVRPAYYDQLDSNPAHVKNSALSMMDTQLVIFDNKLKLKQLDIVSIEAANPGLTGLKGDDNKAWKAKVGAEQYRIGCLDCLVPKLQGDYGYGSTLSDDMYIAAYVGGGIQNDHVNDDYVFARGSFDLIYRPLDQLGIKVNYTKQFNQNTHNSIIKSEVRWAPFESVDFRVRYEKDTDYKNADTLEVGIGAYF